MVKIPPHRYLVVLHKGEVRKVVTGGSVFVNPLTEKVAWIRCDVRTLYLDMNDVESSPEHKRARYNVRARALVNVSRDKELLTRSALRLISMTNKEINSTAYGVIEEEYRSYARYKTPLEVLRAGSDIHQWTIDKANEVLNPQGIEVRSFIIMELEDEYGYFEKVQHGVLDLWLWATDEDGRFIPERKDEYVRQVNARLGRE